MMKRLAPAAIACIVLSACGSSAPAAKPADQTTTSAANATTTTGSTRDTVSQACNATADAASAASAVHFANTGAFPTTFAEMLSATPPELSIGGGVQHTATTLTNPDDWKLTMSGGGASQPTFVCTVLRPVPTIP